MSKYISNKWIKDAVTEIMKEYENYARIEELEERIKDLEEENIKLKRKLYISSGGFSLPDDYYGNPKYNSE